MGKYTTLLKKCELFNDLPLYQTDLLDSICKERFYRFDERVSGEGTEEIDTSQKIKIADIKLREAIYYLKKADFSRASNS